MDRIKTILFMLGAMLFVTMNAQEIIKSPDGAITVEIAYSKAFEISVFVDGTSVIKSIKPALQIVGHRDFNGGERPLSIRKESINKRNETTWSTKNKTVVDHYNLVDLEFANYNLQVRVYNNGWAYRFISRLDGQIMVKDEKLDIEFAQDFISYLPEEKSLISHFENYYQKLPISDIETETMAGLPFLFTDEKGLSVSVTEADLYDYPNLFLKKTTSGFQSLLPRYVLETVPLKEGQDRLEAIQKEADFIAKTDGKRTFPWRVFMISQNDKEIIENDLVYNLSSPLKLKETNWIRPGKVSWEWWNAHNISGVDFKSGLNTETYKYYIDFASEFGLEYIIMDEGWSKSTLNVMEPNPNINMEELVSYAKSKNVGIILWSLWRPLDEQMDALLKRYADWGVKGIKIDFIQRADQYITQFYERLAKKAADYHLVLNFHGGMKPSGMDKAYPNILNYEAVKGMENVKWEGNKVDPNHDIILPFTRMTAGIMDYTPGGMDNVHEENFVPRYYQPMVLGTRAHHLALYVIFESPLQMMADSPTNYYKEKESALSISEIPTVWDKTVVLDAEIGKHVLLARQKDETWFVGAIVGSHPKELTLDFSFLGEGDYILTAFEDGVNSDRNAKDYKKIEKTVTKKSKYNIKMNKGGGWVGKVVKKN